MAKKPKQIRIVLADDHAVVRDGLKALLETEPDFSVVGETGDGLEVLGLLEKLKPDILVVDLNLPGLNGLDITRQARQRFEKCGVIILTMYDEEGFVLEAFRNGALGFVAKCVRTIELIRAIRKANSGKHYLARSISTQPIDVYLARAHGSSLDAYDTLTRRERQVLHLVAEGWTSSQIALQLGNSKRTVETHRTNLMRKLGLSSQTEVVHYAIKRGITPLGPKFLLQDNDLKSE